MNLFTQYLANFIRRIRLAIGRLHVPHCEDCRNLTNGNLCARFGVQSSEWKHHVLLVPADICRADRQRCGKRARYFEPKEGA